MSQDPNHVDPLPADGAPHAYVAVWRLHSPHADRPEWDERNALVVPEWDRERIDRLLALGYDLIPIVPDDEAGTRALGDPLVEQLRQLVADLIDPDDCSFDHHGGCQAHGYLSLEPGRLCPHAEAKQLLAEEARDGE